MYLGWLLVVAGEALLFQSLPLVKYFLGTFAFFIFLFYFTRNRVSLKNLGSLTNNIASLCVAGFHV